MTPRIQSQQQAHSEPRKRNNDHSAKRRKGYRTAVAKKGRIPKLTRSEKRKLARLYTCTELSTEDICEVLRRLHGKTISVRCAQNNIQELLRTYPLNSVRPRDRSDCRLRISQTPCFKGTAYIRETHKHDEHPTLRSVEEAISWLPSTGDFASEELDGISTQSSLNATSQTLSTRKGEGGFDARSMTDTAEEVVTASPLHNIEQKDPFFEEDIFTFLNSEQFISDSSENTKAPEALTTTSIPFDFAQQQPSLHCMEAIPEEPIADQNVADAQWYNGNLEDESGMWLQQSDNENGDKRSKISDVLALGIDSTMSEITWSKPTLDHHPFGTETYRSSQSSNGGQDRVENEASQEANDGQRRSQPRQSWRSTLGSLQRRLSYSSSQMNDIVTAFSHFSLSSKGTRVSGDVCSSVEQFDEMDQTWPHDLTLDTLYTTNYPLNLPGQFINFNIDVTSIEPCSECLLRKAFPCVGICSNAANLNKFIVEYQIHRTPQEDPGFLKPGPRDRFGNTALHVAAAVGADYSSLEMLMKRGARLNEANTAGQTFMHVMDSSKSIKSEEGIPAILSQLWLYGFDFKKVDHHGTNVLQVLLQYPLHHSTMRMILSRLRSQLSYLNFRDNLGRTVQSQLLYLAKESDVHDPERAANIREILSYFYDTDFLKSLKTHAFIRSYSAVSEEDHYDLVHQALNDPYAEDEDGRNGIHCIAEASLKQTGGTLRRVGQRRRFYFVELIRVGVPVNVYDKAGNTPLMAFLHSRQIHAESNGDRETEFYLTELVKAGANVNSRNREGQSALHVAVKFGLITATRVLIKLGANVHVRQKDGKGVVMLGLEVADASRIYKSLHIRIMTCVHMAMKSGAVKLPNLLQEWGLPSSKFDKE